MFLLLGVLKIIILLLGVLKKSFSFLMCSKKKNKNVTASWWAKERFLLVSWSAKEMFLLLVMLNKTDAKEIHGLLKKPSPRKSKFGFFLLAHKENTSSSWGAPEIFPLHEEVKTVLLSVRKYFILEHQRSIPSSWDAKEVFFLRRKLFCLFRTKLFCFLQLQGNMQSSWGIRKKVSRSWLVKEIFLLLRTKINISPPWRQHTRELISARKMSSWHNKDLCCLQ